VCVVCCSTHTEHLRRSVFCCCRTTGLEFLAGRTATLRFSRTIQTAFKDLSIRDMGDHGALWLLVRQRRIEIPILTYLLRARVGVRDGVGKFLLCLTENVRKNVLDPFDSNRNCLIKLVVLFNLDPSKTNLRVLVSYSSCSHHADKLFIYLFIYNQIVHRVQQSKSKNKKNT